MKRMDNFCASPASTAICSSTDRRSVLRPGPSPIDHRYHHHHRLLDQTKNRPHHQLHHAPCSSQLPIDPKPLYEKCRKSFSSAQTQLSRKSSADIRELTRTRSTHYNNGSSSSRFLLKDSTFIDFRLPEAGRSIVPATLVPPAVPSKPRVSVSSHGHSDTVLRSSSTHSRHQVVVLRVSLHCKGCEGKVRKHLSKMEGVTSFSIDFPTKKVTVIGNVTPLAVLSSVSKVKNAQLWPSPASSPSSRWSA